MSDEHTRFLFPSHPQQAIHTVFETTKLQHGMPEVTEKTQQACLPPLKPGARGQLAAPDARKPPLSNSLACYKHYDVQLDWSESDVDTSVWAGDVQAYTRMFYARYGAGPPGATPWRLGRGLKPQRRLQTQQNGKDTDTFMTRAHIEIQDKLQHTSLDLWQQFSSRPIESVDLNIIKMWAEAMRPRSIHDLKPMLMLCQSLLKDLSSVHKEQLLHAQQEMQTSLKNHLEQARLEHQAREKVLQRRIDSLNALVTAPFEPTSDVKATAQVAELKREHENMIASLLAQLEEKDADLVVLAQDVISRGGIPRGANGEPLTSAALPALQPSLLVQQHAGLGASSSPGAASGAVTAAELLSAAAANCSKPMTPVPDEMTRIVAQGLPCGLTGDGKQIIQLTNGVKVILVGYNTDGSPIYASADNPSKIVTAINASGYPIFGDATSSATAALRHGESCTDNNAADGAGQVSPALDAAGHPPFNPSALQVQPAEGLNAAGQEVFVLPDGTRVVIHGRTANGDPIYALADDPLQILSGLDANGSPMFARRSSSGQRCGRVTPPVENSIRGTSIMHNGLGNSTPSQMGVSGTSGGATVALPPGVVPPPEVVVGEDGTKRYVFASQPGAEPLEVGHNAVIATRDDGSPIFAAGTVLGLTADGAAIVADGRGSTFEDATLSNTRVNSAAVKQVMLERETRIRNARLAGVLPQAALFGATRGAGEDHAQRAGEYLAAAVLQHAAPLDTAHAASRSAITAVQIGTTEPEVFTVGEIAVNCGGAVVGHLASNGLEVVDFDGATICTVEKVTHADGEVLRQSGAPLSEEFVDKAAESIVTAAVVRSCVNDDTLLGYMSSHKRVVDDCGCTVGTYDGSSALNAGQSIVQEAQAGELVSIKDITDAAFRGAAQAEQESARVCLPPDFAYAIGPSGKVLGQVLTDGRVVDFNGSCKAIMQPDGLVKTEDGLLVGAAARGMAVMDDSGKLVAVMNEQGFVKHVKDEPLDSSIDMDENGLMTTAEGEVVGVTVGSAPHANAAIRDGEGLVVGYEDARGVVCNSEGVAVSRCAQGGLVGLPGLVPGASDGHTIDVHTTVILDAQSQVVGSRKLAIDDGAPDSDSSHAECGLEAVAVSGDGGYQSNGLVYSSDGSVIGSCVPVIAAGLAVVSPEGTVIGDISAEGVVTSSTGADIGTIDKHNVLWSPSGSVMGAVSALQSVRSSTGSITAAVSTSGAIVDTALAPVPSASRCHADVWREGSAHMGTIQGLPPPLLTLKVVTGAVHETPGSNAGDTEACSPDGEEAEVQGRPRYLSVAWNDLRVTGPDGEGVGWWCCRRSCVVGDAGEELLPTEVVEQPEGPSDRLPQALDQDGNFLGYVLPSKAVVDGSGHQVGSVMPDGCVFDSSLNSIGAFNLGGVKPHCNVVGINGTPIGFLQTDGRVISTEDGANTGFLTPSGVVINNSGQLVGAVRNSPMDGLSQDADGIVRDADGNAVGRVSAGGTVIMGDPFAVRTPPEMVHEAVQVSLVGSTLAQLLAGRSDHTGTPPLCTTPGSRASTSSSGSQVKKLRAATKLIGLTNVSKRNAIKEQLEQLAALRAQILVKMQSRQVKDSLLELRKYRRPPRAAAQVITALMVICNEPLCVEWRHQALQGLQFPDHPNHVAQIWVALTPLLLPNLSEQLAGVDGTDLSQDMQDRLKAAHQIMQGMTEKEAQRASLVVRLLHEFIDLLHESHLRAHEFAQLEE